MSTLCKYYKLVKQVSYDSGQTWTNLDEYMQGDLYESGSTDCGETTKYRWVESGTTCIGFDKYQRVIKQVSYDDGATWTNVVPEEYNVTTLIEADSEDCGYIPVGNKLTVDYFDGTSKTISCDSSNVLGRCEDVVPNFNVTGVTSATVGECVTVLNASFGDCINLSSVTIPDSVTEIGGTVFTDTSLTSITLPSGLTRIGFHDPIIEKPNGAIYAGEAFARCKNLKTINLPSSLESIEYLTFTESGLENITIPASIGVIQYATFRLCTSLTSVTISNGITTIGESAFDFCSGLTSVSIPNSVTSIGKYAFRDCYPLSSITIPSGLTNLSDGVFGGCRSLTSITIPSSVRNIGASAFGDCSGLTSVYIPNNIMSIGDKAFSLGNASPAQVCEITIECVTPPVIGNRVFCSHTSYDSELGAWYCDELNFKIYVPSESLNTYKSEWPDYASIIYPIG